MVLIGKTLRRAVRDCHQKGVRYVPAPPGTKVRLRGTHFRSRADGNKRQRFVGWSASLPILAEPFPRGSAARGW
ncbi:hypothetical protein GCM10022262_09040 [Georgenia daeguensis]|uniref:Uncharacterized protein n=1 Tax=Georgenia daeguensis TaxID=908355 RepID=A0ABP8ERH1_9MICO